MTGVVVDSSALVAISIGQASGIALTPEDLDEIAMAIRYTGAGSGPVPAGQRLATAPQAAR